MESDFLSPTFRCEHLLRSRPGETRLDLGCYRSETDKPGLPAGKWGPEGARLRWAWLQDVVVRLQAQLSTHRPTVQKCGRREEEAVGPKKQGTELAQWAWLGGADHFRSRGWVTGLFMPRWRGSGCVHPCGRAGPFSPRYPAQAWSLLEAARNQGPGARLLPWPAHSGGLRTMRKAGGHHSAQRVFLGVTVTWLGPTPVGDRDKPVSMGQCLWKRVTCQRRVSSEVCRSPRLVPLNSRVGALSTVWPLTRHVSKATTQGRRW